MDIICIPFAFPGLPKIHCAFQTRQAHALSSTPSQDSPYAHSSIGYRVGDDYDRVTANRESLMRTLSFDSWSFVWQVHGTTMRFDPPATDAECSDILEGDGLATSIPGRALVIQTADCQPLLLAHAGGAHVAALHVGWKGNRLGFPQSGVAAFCTHYGLDPADVYAVRGPSLGPGKSEFINYDQEWGPEFDAYHNITTRTVDLWRLTRDQLIEAGLSPDNIFSLDLCTCTLQDWFFSYRRERPCGRQASLIWIGQ